MSTPDEKEWLIQTTWGTSHSHENGTVTYSYEKIILGEPPEEERFAADRVYSEARKPR